MTEWSLPALFKGVHEKVHAELGRARELFEHGPTKGDASEGTWVDLFNAYLPQRYKAAKAHVADSQNKFSLQIDVVIYDELYTPPIFLMGDQKIIPAESVYAVFEAKQVANAHNLKQAHEKAASVRKLHRTSAAFMNGAVLQTPKPPPMILAGLLALESEWKPPLGESLTRPLEEADADSHLDLGCFAANGFFVRDGDAISINEQSKAATAFLFELIARLQALGTVPAFDARAYARWLK